ncbi:hypothetical protein OsI_02065 [Oryza sativa Indica Group]|uniref:SAM-dependent methyltransferase TRM5/TYW2-type domain-containing protein n=1 Tax=Oryza sativa subsp. indica TaxID=39946 RepID=A2WQD6_ORYSI|nr:hypothetical protein OsI_02065 [Oryza sativa Indica Group]
MATADPVVGRAAAAAYPEVGSGDGGESGGGGGEGGEGGDGSVAAVNLEAGSGDGDRSSGGEGGGSESGGGLGRRRYWNSRLSTERQRLVDHVFKNSDVVCDVFSGVGPIAISAARKVFNMDARRFISSIYSSQHVHPVTQVVMNLPNDAAEFLDVFRGISWNHHLAVPSCVMPNIHVYGFSKAEDPEYDFHERINLTLGENVSDVEMHRVRLVAPGKWMLCASFTLPVSVAFAKPNYIAC